MAISDFTSNYLQAKEKVKELNRVLADSRDDADIFSKQIRDLAIKVTLETFSIDSKIKLITGNTEHVIIARSSCIVLLRIHTTMYVSEIAKTFQCSEANIIKCTKRINEIMKHRNGNKNIYDLISDNERTFKNRMGK